MDIWLENWVNKFSLRETTPANNIILIIDNPTERLEKLKLYLEQEGFQIVLACDGNLGLNLALKLKPNLIVCNVLIPGLSGREVLHLLLLTPSTSKTPFIFMSSFTEHLNKKEAMALGADDFLLKPCDPEKLCTSIKTLLKSGSRRHVTTQFN